MIACTTDCVYQHDGCCVLEHAATSGVPSDSGCIHYIPKQVSKYEADGIKAGDSKRENKKRLTNL
ncbi:MAG: hypothetical protein GX541_02780 [Clostridiales bacterium]|jgi:hypothetical protein|nr:hypothetical protein [Clostridiales bacterium]